MKNFDTLDGKTPFAHDIIIKWDSNKGKYIVGHTGVFYDEKKQCRFC